MKNVVNIMREKNLNYILPEKYILDQPSIERGQVVVIVHLHYRETVEGYLKYVECIPEEIDIIFTCSDDVVYDEISQYVCKQKNRNCEVIKKNNRGRDISALLVACREKILNYLFVCFIHDKKEKCEYGKETTQEWIRCLWGNSLGSREYIYNILELFQKASSLGLVVPPSPLEISFYSDLWFDNFENTVKLAQKLKLQCDLDPQKSPITIGTVFWARSVALKKLFEKEWCYEDFDEEPLRNDGTLSHAIERILAYVAQDAGYDTGQVMTDQYAGEKIQFFQDKMTIAYKILRKSLGIVTNNNLENYEQKKDILGKFAIQYKKIYIYGAGVYGKRCYSCLIEKGILPEAFLVSDDQDYLPNIFNIKVLPINQVHLDQACGVIVAVSSKTWADIEKTLKKYFPEFVNIMFME